MNPILIEIQKRMTDCVQKYIPDISFDDLEEHGAVFYMNGRNGTEFDWYVNGKLSDFMMFYNDKSNLGAVKASLCAEGTLWIYVYGEQGKTLLQEIPSRLDAAEEEILSLAVLLKNGADEKNIWDAGIEKINTDSEPDAAQMTEFLSNAPDYAEMKESREMLGQFAYVSGKIMDEGRKVGYMCRDEAVNENDSGWSFMAGDEDEEYVADNRNVRLMSLHEVIEHDEPVWKYIANPVGTKLIRISPEEFAEENADEAPGSPVSGFKYLFLALMAFAGLGLEVILAFALEPALYGYQMSQWNTLQNILHWTMTCILWGLTAFALIRYCKRSCGLDLLARGGKMKPWQLLLVVAFLIGSLIFSYIDWNGSKVVKEFLYNGWLKFIFQYIYYLFETVLVMLILIFGQKAFEIWFRNKHIPYGGIILALTWGLSHFFTKGFSTGLWCMASGLAFGSVYLLVNRDLRKAFPILFIMFAL